MIQGLLSDPSFIPVTIVFSLFIFFAYWQKLNKYIMHLSVVYAAFLFFTALSYSNNEYVNEEDQLTGKGSINDSANQDTIVTENLKSDVQYDSKGFGTGSGIFSGIMMGKTRYYSTASDGSVVLPNYHVSRYVDHFVNNMRNGTQNTNPGFFPKTSPDDKAVDHSTASFYRVNVTGGENQIIIKGDSSPNLDNKGNVTY